MFHCWVLMARRQCFYQVSARVIQRTSHTLKVIPQRADCFPCVCALASSLPPARCACALRRLYKENCISASALANKCATPLRTPHPHLLYIAMDWNANYWPTTASRGWSMHVTNQMCFSHSYHFVIWNSFFLWLFCCWYPELNEAHSAWPQYYVQESK